MTKEVREFDRSRTISVYQIPDKDDASNKDATRFAVVNRKLLYTTNPDGSKVVQNVEFFSNAFVLYISKSESGIYLYKSIWRRSRRYISKVEREKVDAIFNQKEVSVTDLPFALRVTARFMGEGALIPCSTDSWYNPENVGEAQILCIDWNPVWMDQFFDANESRVCIFFKIFFKLN